MTEIKLANSIHLKEVIEWLKTESDDAGTGFYCNRSVIAKSFENGKGLCIFDGERIVGFAIFQMMADGGDVDIVEVKPSDRRRGLGSELLLAAVVTLQQLGAKYVDVECTSQEGEALCRQHGFQDYIDPMNHFNEWDNPKLRLYLSKWRPQQKLPWA